MANPMQKTVYHVKDGAAEMYVIDANNACATFPEEWSHEPWPEVDEAPAVDKADVEIPEDWGALSVYKKRALAIKLGAPPTVSAAEAKNLIAAEVKRREPLQAADE